MFFGRNCVWKYNSRWVAKIWISNAKMYFNFLVKPFRIVQNNHFIMHVKKFPKWFPAIFFNTSIPPCTWSCAGLHHGTTSTSFPSPWPLMRHWKDRCWAQNRWCRGSIPGDGANLRTNVGTGLQRHILPGQKKTEHWSAALLRELFVGFLFEKKIWKKPKCLIKHEYMHDIAQLKYTYHLTTNKKLLGFSFFHTVSGVFP